MLGASDLDSVSNCAVTASEGSELRRCAVPWRGVIGIAS